MATSIPISLLNPLAQISSSDYIPIIQNSTTTTFKSTLNSISNWISASVASSASISAISSSYSLSGSFSNNSNISITSSYLSYPNNSTSSYAITSSRAITASIALNVIGGFLSASWSSASLFAVSSSWSSASLFAVSSSWASSSISSINSINSTSSSWASSSISSSYSHTTQSSSYISLPYTPPYPYIHSMSFWSTHDDCCDVCFSRLPSYTWNKVPGTYNGFNGWTNNATTQSIGMFVFGNSGLSYFHGIHWDSVVNRYVQQGGLSGTNATSSITYPVQLMTIFSDNRGGGQWWWYIQSPITVCFCIASNQYKTYTITPGGYNGEPVAIGGSQTYNSPQTIMTIDANRLNYENFKSNNDLNGYSPLYFDMSIIGIYLNSNVPFFIFSVSSSYS